MVRKKETASLEIWCQVLGAVRTNCYLIIEKETRDAVIVDPADSVEAIIKMCETAEAKVSGILLTHGHFDHITAAAKTAARLGTKIYACEAEKELLADENMNCSTMGDELVELTADVWLKDKETLTFGSLTLKTIYTPGHTKGGMCYYFPEDKVLISGDTLFLESVGRTDLPTGNGGEILASLKNRLLTLPEDVLVLPGHGAQTTIGYEKRNNPYAGDNIWE